MTTYHSPLQDPRPLKFYKTAYVSVSAHTPGTSHVDSASSILKEPLVQNTAPTADSLSLQSTELLSSWHQNFAGKPFQSPLALLPFEAQLVLSGQALQRGLRAFAHIDSPSPRPLTLHSIPGLQSPHSSPSAMT